MIMAAKRKSYSCSDALNIKLSKSQLEKIAGQKLTDKQADNLAGYIAAEFDGSLNDYFDTAAELAAEVWRDMGDDA
jgi:hypothetical protein